VSGMTQFVVDDSCRGREGITDFAHSDTNRRALDDTVGEAPLLVEVQAIDAHVTRRLGIESSYAPRTINPDALESERQPKCVIGGRDRIVRRVLGPGGTQWEHPDEQRH